MIGYSCTGTAAIFNSKTGLDKSGLKVVNSKIQINDFESAKKNYKNTKILKL